MNAAPDATQDGPHGDAAEKLGPLGRFDGIDEQECTLLLRDASVARIGFMSEGRVYVLPITHTMVDDTLLVFGTRPGSVMAPLHEAGVPVAVEIDSLDFDTATGYSVLAQGLTESVTPQSLEGLLPWAPGNRSLPVGVRLTRRTGRIVSRAED